MSEGPLKVALAALNRPGHQSLALGYLRAYAEAHERLRGKVAFQTLDLTTDADPWRVAYQVLGMAPDVAGLSVSCWNARSTYEACGVIAAARPETFIVLGGPEVGPCAEEVLRANPAVSAVVRGEGEETFAELLRVLASGKRPSRVEGVTAREGGEIVSAPDRELIADLDTIPSPYLAGVLTPLETMSYLETFRGCPHACAFCYEAKGSNRIRSFSEGRVRAELEAVASAPWVRELSFIDSVFNLTPARLRWLSELLEPHARAGLRLHTIEVDIERIDDEAAGLLARAGVASVETGPQSVGARALETCDRKLDPDRFIAGIEALKRVGIRTECDLIIGLPGDDAYDVLAGLRWLLAVDPGTLQASTLRVLPGTKLAACAEDVGLSYDRDPEHAVIRTRGIGFADIRRLEVMAHSLQQGYRARVG